MTVLPTCTLLPQLCCAQFVCVFCVLLLWLCLLWMKSVLSILSVYILCGMLYVCDAVTAAQDEFPPWGTWKYIFIFILSYPTTHDETMNERAGEKKTTKLYVFLLIRTQRGSAGIGTMSSVVFWLLDGKEEKHVIFGIQQICDSWCEGPLYSIITRQSIAAGQASTEHVRCMCVNTQLVTWPGGVFCFQMTDYHFPLDIRPVNEVSWACDGFLMWENVRSR